MTCDVQQVSSFLFATSPDWMSALGIEEEEEEEEEGVGTGLQTTEGDLIEELKRL